MKNTSKIKRLATLGLIFLLSINSFAAIVSDNDGSAFVTKAEFDALKANFAEQVNKYNSSIDGKIDGAIAQYLDGLKTSKIENYSTNGQFFSYPLTLYGKRVIKTLDMGKTTPTYINQEVGVTPPTGTHYEPLFGPDYVMFGALMHSYFGERSWGYLYHKPTRYVNRFYRGSSINGDTIKINGTYLPGAWTWTAMEIPDMILGNVKKQTNKTSLNKDNRKDLSESDGPLYWALGMAYLDQQFSVSASAENPKINMTSKLRANYDIYKSTEDKPQRIWGEISYRPYSFSNYAKQIDYTSSKGVGSGLYIMFNYAYGSNEPLSTNWSNNSYKFNTLDTVSELDIFSVSGIAGTDNTTDYQVPVSIGDKVYVTNFQDKINVNNNPDGRLDLWRRNKLDGYDLFQGFVDGGLDLESEKQSTGRTWDKKSLIQSARIVYDAKFDDGKTVSNHNMTHMIPLTSLSNLPDSDNYVEFNLEINIDYTGSNAPYIVFAKKAVNQQSKPDAADTNFLKIVKANGTSCDANSAVCLKGLNSFEIDGLATNDVLYYKLFWNSDNGETVTIKELPKFSFYRLS